MRVVLYPVSLATTLIASLGAQDRARPPGWQVRFDRAEATDTSLLFVAMPPGWHITARHGAVLYNPATQMQGEFVVEIETHVFPDASNDGFGIMLAGQGLHTAEPSYLVFVIRKDGCYALFHQAGPETHEVIPWTRDSTVVRQDGASGSVRNTLTVHAAPRRIRLVVNGREVKALTHEHLQLDGIIGLHVGSGVNVHVSRLDVR